jgi:hypothetical protein
MAAQAGPAWRDPSPHQVRFVTVDSSVKLEVLDWSGTGRPLVFVGCYLTAHVYDDIAPKLTDRFHVYGLTRRGVGASDRPSIGYDPKRRAEDMLDVITALGMHSEPRTTARPFLLIRRTCRRSWGRTSLWCFPRPRSAR